MAKKKDAEKSAQSEENNRSSNIENGENEEPNFSDPEGYVDDISDEELLGDFLKNKPTETDGVESVIVVDGIPQVGPDRFEKLTGVINKFFSRIGTIVNEFYPKTEAGITKGYCFIEYSSPLHAIEAVKITNNHKLDKQHTFLVNLFTDFKKCDEIPESWEPPQPNKYKEQGNLHYYLLDPDAYDQFVVTVGSGQALQIWLNTAPEPTKVEERNRWTETYCKWSPLGSYLATFHRKGLALWGGPTFEQIQRFSHMNVQFIDFSPCETYLVTYSPSSSDVNSDQKALIIWDVRTGIEKRSFTMESGQNLWPIFRWSYNDQYFARIVGDVLSVYVTPSFGLLDKKSVRIPGIRDFSWSPSDNVLAYWVAENKDVPARVTLLEIPSRNEIRPKNLFNVADCKIHWQKSGEYLCVKVDRYSKVKKEKNDVKYSGMYYNFEIFHMRGKQIPVDSVEIKETIHAFAWEPVGNKFAIIHGDTPSINVSFYGVKTGQAPTLLKRLEKRNCNHLFWAPTGQFIVLAGLRNNMSGVLEFIDTNDFISMNVTDHFQCSDVEWDPTGRYVVTAVSFWKTKMDTGYWMWSFQGKLLKRVYLDNFCQFLWRPRPPALLSAEKQKEIKKSLKKYSSQFESKDRMRLTKASKELIEKRQKLMQEFEEHRKKRLQQWALLKTRRLELRNNIDTDELDSDTTNVEEEIVEFLVKEETTIID